MAQARRLFEKARGKPSAEKLRLYRLANNRRILAILADRERQHATFAQPQPAPFDPIVSLRATMSGEGTYEVPYLPRNDYDYLEMPSGSHYVHPADGTLRVKK